MRTTETVMVPTRVTTYTCDYCPRHTTSQAGHSGHAIIMACNKCNKDGCDQHMKCYAQPHHDYCDYHICTTCQPKMDHVWDIASFLYDEEQHYFPDLVDNIWVEYEDHKHILEKIYRPFQREDIMDVPDVDL